MSRPTKLDAERSAKIVQLIRAGNYIETAAAAAGIVSTTFRTWLKRGREDIEKGRQTDFAKFAADVEEAQAAAEALLVVGVAQAAKKDWRAAAFLLERKWPKKYGSRVEVSGEGFDAIAAALLGAKRSVGEDGEA